MAPSRRLGIELCFRPSPSAELWRSVMRAVVAWDPRLAPQRLDRLSDADRPGEEAWSDARWDELARWAAAEPSRSWQLIGRDATLDVSRKSEELRVSIALAAPAEPPTTFVEPLLEALPVAPALAMLLDVESQDDGRFLFQGLAHLDDVPPAFFLDGEACERLGGAARLRQAPVEVHEAAKGGLLFIVIPLFQKRRRADSERIAAFRKFLGISPASPLSLVGSPATPVAMRWNVEQDSIDRVHILGVPVAPVLEGPALNAGCASAGGDGWVVGDRGTIAYRDADDAEWGTVETNGLPARSFTAVCDVRDADVWVVGEHGTIVRFDGDGWREMPTPSESQRGTLRGVWGANAGVALAVGDGGLALTWNGAEWYADESTTRSTLFAVSGAGGVAWAVGEQGVLLRWDGDTWAAEQSPTTATLHGVCAVSRELAWAVGTGGTILRRNDGRWQPVESDTRADLRAVWATAQDDVWVVGEQGCVRHFDGTRWTEVATDVRESLRAVWSDGDTGVWICGSNHLLLRITPTPA